MGIDSLKPQRIFFFHSIKTTKAANMPKGSGLTKPMKLSADLADIVGKKEASRAECNKQLFIPDKKMAKIFGTDKIRAFGMAKFLSAHLSWTLDLFSEQLSFSSFHQIHLYLIKFAPHK